MSIDNLLDGKIAIVTGAGRGLGRATALLLAKAGATVVLAARSGDQLTGVAEQIKQNNGQALAIPTDVSNIGQVDHLLVLTLRAFGGVDILVNNAALISPLGKVWETSPLAWQQLMGVNLIGPYLCARAMLPHMLEKGNGRIINVSSGAANRNIVGASAYTVSKAALERFSDSLATELKGSGVVVTTFRPGIIDTPMQAHIRGTPEHLFPPVTTWQSWYDTGQLRPPEEPAYGILWLASHYAAKANGQIFGIDDESFRRQIAADLGIKPFKPRNR